VVMLEHMTGGFEFRNGRGVCSRAGRGIRTAGASAGAQSGPGAVVRGVGHPGFVAFAAVTPTIPMTCRSSRLSRRGSSAAARTEASAAAAHHLRQRSR
jgi:hypothetical protein